jgi:hypothetical protein
MYSHRRESTTTRNNSIAITGGVPMPKVTTAKGSKTYKSVSAAKAQARKSGGKVSRVKGKKYTR